MKALVLAAGKGSRLAGAGGGVPKPLVDIAGRTPLLENVRWAAATAREGIWINTHDAAQLVRDRVGAEVDGVRIRYSHEPELLGTAGAWKKLEREWRDGPSLVVYGDNLMRFDLAALVRAHAAAGTVATVALFDPARHANTGIGGGRAELGAGAVGGARIRRFVEGGAEGLVNAGVYVLDPSLADELPGGFLDFGHDVLPVLAASGRLAGHVVEAGAYCLGVDTPDRLETARALMRRMEANP